ncbi:MAG: hypothetical protein ACHRXM_25285 [Isosphaerales bacterium]
MPEELTNAEQTQLASAVPQELPKAKKIQLAAAIAEGESIAEWARENGVHRGTAFRWAREPNVRRVVEACRRRTFDQAIGRMTKRTPWACDRIAMLAEAAESESVQLRALRSIFADVMAVAKFSNLENRVAQLEEDYREQNGNPDDVA